MFVFTLESVATGKFKIIYVTLITCLSHRATLEVEYGVEFGMSHYVVFWKDVKGVFLDLGGGYMDVAG